MFWRIRHIWIFSLVSITLAVLGLRYRDWINDAYYSFASPHSGSSITMPPPAPTPVVIVVGSGLAGLSAAYEALKVGAAVRLLDRAAKPGGNSIKASSGINGAGTPAQKAAGILHDESFHDDTVRSAGRRFRDAQARGDELPNRAQLVDTLTRSSAGAVAWLVDDVGVDLSVVAALGGHSVARTHRPAGKTPPGAAIVTALLQKLKANPRFELSSEAEVVAFEAAPGGGGVTGVRFVQAGASHQLAGPVVFAAGGFAGDATGLLARYRPDLTGLPSTNDARPASHDLLTPLGVQLVDMDSVQIHPTGFVDPADPAARYKFLAAEALRGEGGILLDGAGKRFTNELATREEVARAIMALPRDPAVGSDDNDSSRQWDITLLLDPGACDAVAGHLSFYTWKGLMRRTKVSDLDDATIAAVDAWAAAVAAGADAAFGRTVFGRWRLPPGDANRDQEVCVGRVTPVTHFTMGGAAFNARAQPLATAAAADGSGDEGTAAPVPVPGLWVAGEITGGIHGDNRLGGSSLLECAVFGRLAGAEAAKAALGL